MRTRPRELPSNHVIGRRHPVHCRCCRSSRQRLHPHDVSWRPRPARRCPPVCGPSRSVLSPAHVPSRTAARSLRPPTARWFPPCLGLGDPPWCVDSTSPPRLWSVHGELGWSQIPATVNTGAPASFPGPAVILWDKWPPPVGQSRDLGSVLIGGAGRGRGRALGGPEPSAWWHPAGTLGPDAELAPACCAGT